MTGAPIIPLFCFRADGGTDSVILENPVFQDKSGDIEQAALDTVGEYIRLLESYIHRCKAELTEIATDENLSESDAKESMDELYENLTADVIAVFDYRGRTDQFIKWYEANRRAIRFNSQTRRYSLIMPAIE